MDWLQLLAAAGIGVVVGALIGPFLLPWARKAEQAGRAVAGENPVDVLVDTDQAVIWAGNPPWVGFSYYFSGGLPNDDPPDACFDWSQWAYKRRGVDVGLTMLQVTIQAKLNATVVLDPPVVRIVSRQPVSTGAIAMCGAGGADLVPRHFEIDLDAFDPPAVRYLDEGQEPAATPAFALASGDVERLHIWVTAPGSELLEWTLELPVIVNGTRRSIPVSGPTDFSFRTLGSGAPVQGLLRSDLEWEEHDSRH